MDAIRKIVSPHRVATQGFVADGVDVGLTRRLTSVTSPVRRHRST